MHQALVEDAKNDVDSKQRGQNQDRFGAERLLVGLQSSGKKATDRRGHAQTLLHLVDAQGGLAQGDAGCEIEGDGDRGKQTSVVDRERYRVALRCSHGEKRRVARGGNAAASVRVKIYVLEALGGL